MMHKKTGGAVACKVLSWLHLTFFLVFWGVNICTFFNNPLFLLFLPIFSSFYFRLFCFFNLCHRRGVFSTFRPQFPPTTVHKSESSHVKDGAICGNVSNPWNPWCEMYVITTIAEMQLLPPPPPYMCMSKDDSHLIKLYINPQQLKVSWANEVKRNSFSNRIFYYWFYFISPWNSQKTLCIWFVLSDPITARHTVPESP